MVLHVSSRRSRRAFLALEFRPRFRSAVRTHGWLPASSCHALQNLAVEVLVRCKRRDHVAAHIGQAREIHPRDFGLVFKYENGLEVQIVTVEMGQHDRRQTRLVTVRNAIEE